MEYLVTMMTHVPAGTPEESVEDVKAREAAHSRELAAQGHLLRLWRPPLQPGEWRSIGLFAAGSTDQLHDVLSGMPLHIWRTDEVAELAQHPNDPVVRGVRADQASPGQTSEFLTMFAVTIPPGTADAAVRDATAGEASSTRELARQGHLIRLWKLPAEGQALGLWRAADSAAMSAILRSLPLDPWMTEHTTALTPHPSDPAALAAANG